MQKCPDVIVCEECDAVYAKVKLASGETACCVRCGARLDSETGSRFSRMLPLTLACLILFVMANAFAIVDIEMQGIHSQATLLKAVHILYAEGQPLVSILVFLTTFFFPLGQLLILLYLLLPWRKRGSLPHFGMLLRFMQILRPWGMIEVFLLGVLVALVKLSNMVTVIPNVALWAFGALTVLLAIVISFNLRYFWEIYTPDATPAGETA